MAHGETLAGVAIAPPQRLTIGIAVDTSPVAVAFAHLRVPKSQEPALARMATLDDAEERRLDEALRDSVPGYSIQALATQVREKSHIEDAPELVRLLAMLYAVRDRERVEPSDFLLEVERAARATNRPELVDPGVDWPSIRARIGRLLQSESLGVTAKAFDVLSEHERMFCGARVLTDMRPIFASSTNRPPQAFVLVHELRISYHEGDELKSVYIAMDSDDIRSLRDILARASEKEASLEVLSTKTAPLLKARSHERP